VVAQGLDERGGQHGDPVAAALALPDHHFPARELHILDSQLQAFREPHAGAMEKAGHERMRAVHAGKEGPGLLPREYHGKPPGTLRLLDAVQPGKLHPQHLLVEEEQGGERLVLRAGRNAATVGQGGQEGLHLLRAELARVAVAVEAEIAPRPVHAGLLRAQAVVANADLGAELAEEGAGVGVCRLCHFHSIRTTGNDNGEQGLAVDSLLLDGRKRGNIC